MPLETLPTDINAIRDWTWEQYAPYFEALQARTLTADNVSDWLAEWSQIHNLVFEVFGRLRLAHDQDTNDEEAERRYFGFLETIFPHLEKAEHVLREKLLQSGEALTSMDDLNMGTPLRKLRAEAELFREENIPLNIELNKLGSAYQKIVGSQTASWEGEEVPLPQLKPVLSNPDRAVRERVWRLAQERRHDDREALNDLWQKMLPLRRQTAANAGCADYR